MSGRPIKKGTTNVSSVVRIIDSTDGTPEIGVVAATAGLAFNYRREAEAAVAITGLNNLALLTTAHADGGILHIGDGYYRIDFQDAAFAAGAGEDGVLLTGTATGMIVIGTYHPLVDYDPYDAIRMGMTALPAAAADAAGGLPISDTGGLDLDAMNTNINDIETDTAEIGAAGVGLSNISLPATGLDLVLKTSTYALAMADAVLDEPLAGHIVVDTVGPVLNDWQNNGRLDVILDAILVDTADIQPKIGTPAADLSADIAAVVADTNELQTDWADGGRLDLLVDAIKVITDAIGATAAANLAKTLSNGGVVPFTVDTVVNTHTPTVTEFQADDVTEATPDHYNGRIIIWLTGSLTGQATDITDYAAVGGIGQFTITSLTDIPANNDTGIIV